MISDNTAPLRGGIFPGFLLPVADILWDALISRILHGYHTPRFRLQQLFLLQKKLPAPYGMIPAYNRTAR